MKRYIVVGKDGKVVGAYEGLSAKTVERLRAAGFKVLPA